MEQAILSSCERMTTKDRANALRVTNITSRVEEGFGTRLLETSGDEGVSTSMPTFYCGEKSRHIVIFSGTSHEHDEDIKDFVEDID